MALKPLRFPLVLTPPPLRRIGLADVVMLCLVGGAMGIGLGRLASIVVNTTLRWPTLTSPLAMAAALTVSATVGILFGFYPAWKASRLDPIDALRYE